MESVAGDRPKLWRRGYPRRRKSIIQPPGVPGQGASDFYFGNRRLALMGSWYV
jgi:hypothetical protein